MPQSSGSGKRSLKNTSSQYSGQSASQQLNSWGSWQEYNQQGNIRQGPRVETAAAWTGEDYDKPWFERKDGEWYCLLCNKYANEFHLSSDGHQKRALDPQWYGFSALAGDARLDTSAQGGMYDKPWFEMREGDYYCLLCSQWATETHLTGARHTKRAEYPEYYGFCMQQQPQQQQPAPAAYAAQAAAAPGPACQPAEFREPWFELREGDWYCLLCQNYATEGHLTGQKHLGRVQCPEWYFTMPKTEPAQDNWSAPRLQDNGSAQPVAELADADVRPPAAKPTRPRKPAVPPGWVAYWSEEHEDFYYHEKETGHTTWDPPYVQDPPYIQDPPYVREDPCVEEC